MQLAVEKLQRTTSMRHHSLKCIAYDPRRRYEQKPLSGVIKP